MNNQGFIYAPNSSFAEVFACTTHSPADSVTYSFGRNETITPQTTLNTTNSKFFTSKTFSNAQIHWRSGTLGSNQLVEVYLRNTTTSTDQLITNSLDLSAAVSSAATLNISGLNISVNNTDNYVIKIVCPIWTTNPINSAYKVILF